MRYWRRIAAALSVAMTLITFPAAADPISVVALGDSNTNGFGMGRASAWPTLIEKWLREKSPPPNHRVHIRLGTRSVFQNSEGNN